MSHSDSFDSLSRSLTGKIQIRTEFRGETTFTILPDHVYEVAKFCRDELAFDYLIDISSVDNYDTQPRFELVYELYSMASAVHLRLKTTVREESAGVDTESDLWQTAN